MNKYVQQLGISDYEMQKAKYTSLDAKILDELEKTQTNEIRQSPLGMELKVSSCLSQLIGLIHDHFILESRFERTKALLVTTSSYVRAKRNEARNLDKFDKMNLPFSFSSYPVFQLVCKLEFKEVSSILFSHNKYSLYKHLIL